MPVTEIVTFATSDAYRADQGVLDKTVDILKKEKGYINVYHGPQVEDSKTGYIFVVWDTYEDHKAVMEAPSYPVLIDSLKVAVAGSLDMVHIKFNKDPTAALSAPVVEIVYLTLKSGQPSDVINSDLDKLTNLGTKTVISATWGPSIEKEDLLVMIVGWESLEAHHEAVKTPNEVAQGIAATLIAKTTFTLAHSKLVKF